MAAPFIIWTMRRTGGTSFANILQKITDCQLEHEPFNWDRTLGFITQGFKNDRDNFDFFASSLQQSCIDKQICLKHCYEIIGPVFSECLIEVLSKTNYKHIFLLRRNELSRLLSLYTAKYTDVWGKHGSQEIYEQYFNGEKKLPLYDIEDMKKHLWVCNHRTKTLKEKMSDCNISFLEIYYEDLYSGNFEQRKQFLKNICNHIEISSESFENNTEDLKYLLMKANQKSNNLYDLIPNLKEIKEIFSVQSVNV